MDLFRQVAGVAAAVVTLAGASVAHAVPFEINAASFSAGAGYGVDANEGSGTLLDVRFSTSIFSQQDFSLSSIGSAFTFSFGTVSLQEPNSNGGIKASETDNLDVLAFLTFANPQGATSNLVASGSAVAGSIADSASDYTLVWNPLDVSFGSGGLFRVALSDLSFSEGGTQTQFATISLLQLPSEQISVNAVPEPATLVLIGAGLFGLGTVRRKRPA